MDCSPSGSSVHGISQARKLDWVTSSFSRVSSWSRDQTPISWFGSFPGGLDGKASAYNARDLASIPGSERSPGEVNGNSLQYSFLENPMDGGAWWAIVHAVTESQTQLSNLTFTFFTTEPSGKPTIPSSLLETLLLPVSTCFIHLPSLGSFGFEIFCKHTSFLMPLDRIPWVQCIPPLKQFYK